MGSGVGWHRDDPRRKPWRRAEDLRTECCSNSHLVLLQERIERLEAVAKSTATWQGAAQACLGVLHHGGSRLTTRSGGPRRFNWHNANHHRPQSTVPVPESW